MAFLLTSVAAFPFIGIIIAVALQGTGILPRFSLYWLIVAAAIVLLLIGLGWARDRHRRKRLAEFSIVLVAVLWMACDLVFRIRGGADRLTLWLAIPLYFLIPVVVLFVSRRRGIRKSLWVYLNAYGKATCVSCGYDLTSNESGVCPECGSEVQA